MFSRVMLFSTLLVTTINCGTDNSSPHSQTATPSTSNDIAVAVDQQTQQRLCAEACEHFRQTCNPQPGDVEDCLDGCHRAANAKRSEFFKPLVECILNLSVCYTDPLARPCETLASVGLNPTKAHTTYASTCVAISNTCNNVDLDPKCDAHGEILTFTDEHTNTMTACFKQPCDLVQECLSALD